MADVTRMTLEDGRMAEKHVTINEDGNEVIEIFAEEKKPLKLEKKVIREYKKVVAKEVHQTVKDGVVVGVEEKAVAGDVALRLVDRIGLADHASLVDGEYVKKSDVADAVVAAVSMLMDNAEIVKAQSVAPTLSAMSVVENNVAEAEKGKKNYGWWSLVGAMLVVQGASFYYVMFMR